MSCVVLLVGAVVFGDPMQSALYTLVLQWSVDGFFVESKDLVVC